MPKIPSAKIYDRGIVIEIFQKWLKFDKDESYDIHVESNEQ